jgi:hypothetical protein
MTLQTRLNVALLVLWAVAASGWILSTLQLSESHHQFTRLSTATAELIANDAKLKDANKELMAADDKLKSACSDLEQAFIQHRLRKGEQ